MRLKRHIPAGSKLGSSRTSVDTVVNTDSCPNREQNPHYPITTPVVT